MAEANRLYRSDDEVVSGVCAGIAERFDIDPAAARILAVLLTATTAGLALGVYAILWLVLPKRSEAPTPIACAAYVAPAPPHPAAPARGTAPVPPAGFVVQDGACRPCAPSGPAASADEARCESAGMAGWSRFCVWFGSAVLAVDAALLVDFLVDGIVWWRLWPVVLVVAGTVLMFVPARSCSRPRRFSGGLALTSLGVVLSFISVGVLSPDSAVYALSKMWPMVLVMAGLMMMGSSLHDDMFDLAAALCVVVVCVAACTAFALPGPLEYVTAHTPFGPRVYDINPWL